jgi:hypothetical protein
MHRKASDNPKRPPSPNGSRGAILLEVVLALTLLMAGSAVVLGSLSASARRAEQLRIEAHGQDLLASLMTEIQVGLREAKDAGPTPYEAPFADFSWQIAAADLPAGQASAPVMRQVTAIVRHRGQSVAAQEFRLSEWVEAASTTPPGGAP